MKKTSVLIILALICAIYLSAALLSMGLEKFDYVLAGGKKFATFPDLSSQLGIGVSYFALGIIYTIWLLGTPRSRIPERFPILLTHAAIFLILAFLSYPLGDDIYLYLHAGLMNLSGINPFLIRAGSFISELSIFVDWGQTSTYGPISQGVFTLSAALIQFSPILSIYAYKSFCLGLHVLNGYLIWKLLQSSPDRSRIAIAYLINPLLLMEQVGSAHVDVCLSTSAIVFVGSLTSQRYGAAFTALWGGFLAKTLPILWMPLVAVFLIRKQRWWHLGGILLLSLGLVTLLWYTVLPGLPAWNSLLNPGVAGHYQASLHALVKAGMELASLLHLTTITPVQEHTLLLQLTRHTLAGFAAFYSWIVWRLCRKRSYTEANLIEDIAWVTLVLLLVATPWLMPWYASIALTLAALTPQSKVLGITSLMFGLASTAQYLLQGHNSLKSFVMLGLPAIAAVIATTLIAQRSLNIAESVPSVRSQ
jgi:alpha-1,6-mannosyltransferase